MDHFRRGHFQGFTDLSLAASWNQVRQGILVVHALRHCPKEEVIHILESSRQGIYSILRKCSELEDEGERDREGLNPCCGGGEAGVCVLWAA